MISATVPNSAMMLRYQDFSQLVSHTRAIPCTITYYNYIKKRYTITRIVLENTYFLPVYILIAFNRLISVALCCNASSTVTVSSSFTPCKVPRVRHCCPCCDPCSRLAHLNVVMHSSILLAGTSVLVSVRCRERTEASGSCICAKAFTCHRCLYTECTQNMCEQQQSAHCSDTVVAPVD
jgi:hypothetical protein